MHAVPRGRRAAPPGGRPRGRPARRRRGAQLPYLEEEQLDLRAWARDALALALPTQIVCREDCLGLCPVCGENLNQAGPDHGHEREPDPRWAALRELKLE